MKRPPATVPWWRRPLPPWLAGASLGVAAALTSLAFPGGPPAYGLCVACHARDLVTRTLGGIPGLQLEPALQTAGGWILTVPGLLLGAHLGARLGAELRLRASRRLFRSFLLGGLAMCCSLLALGCTSRLLLRAAYGDLWAFGSLGAAAGGITAGTILLAWQARRVQQ